jgi:hypothetical protein
MLFAFASESELKTSPSDWLGDLEAILRMISSPGRGLTPSLQSINLLARILGSKHFEVVEPDQCRPAYSPSQLAMWSRTANSNSSSDCVDCEPRTLHARWKEMKCELTRYQNRRKPPKSGEPFGATIRGQNIVPLYIITLRRRDLKPLLDRSLECDRSYSPLPPV